MSEATVAGARVKIGGTPLEEEGQLIEVRVEENLVLPDSFLLRLSDAGLGLVDSARFDVGKTVEVDLGGADSSALGSVFKGEITSLEPVFEQNRAEVAVRGYDESHQLHRTRRTMTYQNVTSSDIAKKVAQQAGFSLGQVDESGPNPPHAFVQQNNETDWDLLQRLARLHDFEVLVQDRKLHFRRAGRPQSSVKLKWGEELISFRPRVSGIQQVKEVVVRGWDPLVKDVIEAKATVGAPDSRIGVERGAASRRESRTAAWRPRASAAGARKSGPERSSRSKASGPASTARTRAPRRRTSSAAPRATRRTSSSRAARRGRSWSC